MQEIWEEHQGEGVMIIGIGVDASEAACQAWITSHGLTYLVLSDRNRTVWNLFGMNYVPHNAVLDCDFNVLYTYYGYDEDTIMNHVNSELQRVVAVEHTPVHDTEDTSTPIVVTASFHTNSPFSAGFPVMAWADAATGIFTAVQMTQTRWEDYAAEIPAQPEGTDIVYYFDLLNDAGCQRKEPPGAPINTFQFHVGMDTTPPVIIHECSEFLPDEYLPMVVSADVTDNLGLASVTLEYNINGGEFHQIEMAERGRYSAEIPDGLHVGDVVNYRIIAVDGAHSPNTAYHPETGYHSTTIVDKIPALIVDLDASHNSGPMIQSDLEAYLGGTDYQTSIPQDLSGYSSIFVCLGIYGSGNHQLSSSEGQQLADYLDRGGNLYMEGGDTWYYDPQTPVHSYFKINGTNDGNADAGPIDGVPGTVTEGMHWGYSSAGQYNNYIDHLTPQAGAEAILHNVSPSYYAGIAYRGGSYRTVGVSIVYGGLQQANRSEAREFLEAVLDFFDMSTPPATPTPPPPTSTPEPTRTPTPSEPTATPTPFICVHDGDVNNSGDITPDDALFAFHIYLGAIPDPSPDEFCGADCNGSDTVTPEDALCIFRHFVNGSCDCVDSR